MGRSETSLLTITHATAIAKKQAITNRTTGRSIRRSSLRPRRNRLRRDRRRCGFHTAERTEPHELSRRQHDEVRKRERRGEPENQRSSAADRTIDAREETRREGKRRDEQDAQRERYGGCDPGHLLRPRRLPEQPHARRCEEGHDDHRRSVDGPIARGEPLEHA